MESFLSSYGLIVLFIGMLLEGELLLLSAIILAKVGHFEFTNVVAVAYFGAVGHDWLFYLLGKTQDAFLFKERPSLKQKVMNLFSPINRSPVLFYTFYRFMIGFRMIILAVFGISGLTIQKFIFISLFANFLWIGTYGLLGYYFADVVIENLEWINQYKIYLIIGFIGMLYIVKKGKEYTVGEN